VSIIPYVAMFHLGGPLVFVEAASYWHSRLKEYINRFAGGSESIQADRVITTIEGAPVGHYDMPHDRYYDFVYVDGRRMIHRRSGRRPSENLSHGSTIEVEFPTPTSN